MSKNKNFRWLSLLATGVMAVALSGCGGGDDGAAGPQGPKGDTGDTGAAGSAGPAGTATVNLAAITPEAWETAKFKAEISKVTIASKPVVEFAVTDASGNPVVGLEKVTSKSASATVASYPNLAFAMAKLMPRTDSKPSSWVSYIVTTGSPATAARVPTTDNTGTLEAVADKPGNYKYTFYRDVPGIKAEVDALTTHTGNNVKADLGDLSWTPTLPHRLVIQIGGAAPGTGSNTSNAVTVTPAVNLANPVNLVYDFIPATGKVLTAAELTREDVNIASCNVCHEKLAAHGASVRVETRYCVVCHTEQLAYGQPKKTSTNGSFTALVEKPIVDPASGITRYVYSKNTQATSSSYHPNGTEPINVGDGEVMGNFNTMIHKIHNGRELVKDNYNFANVVFNNKGFSKLGGGQRMCTTCHDSKIASTADNYKNLPSRVACGSCHDGINWETGNGSTLADKRAATAVGAIVATSGHVGRAQADDSRCALCHTPAYVKLDHRMENITKNNPEIADGLATFTYEIKSATVNGGNDVTIEFGVKQRIAPSTTDTLVTLATPAASVTTVLPGFTGGPGFLLAYAMTQDGVTEPIDYNNLGRKQGQPISFTLANLLSTSNAANGSVVPSATNAGYYTATIKGNGTWAFPAGAKLRAVALQSYFTQTSAPASVAAPVGRHAISVVKAVTGDTARRVVVDAEKCSNCHEWFEGHGGSRVKETQVCVTCHVPALATSGRGISDAKLAAYTFNAADTGILSDWSTFFNKSLPNAALNFPVTSNNFKDMIHGIHAGRERVSPFQDARDRTSAITNGVTGGAITLLDFRRMDFPGKLNNCETCHVTAATTDQKTYNFVPANALLSTYESIDLAYAAGIAGGTATPTLAKTALNTANATDIVTTPYAAACVSCHDNAATKAHVTLNGAVVKGARSTAVGDVEACAVCHGPGREFDTVKVHK